MATKKLYFKPGTLQRIVWFGDSPDTGDPACVCSLCGLLIKEDETPLRIFRDGNFEARLHQECAHAVIDWYGVANQRGKEID